MKVNSFLINIMSRKWQMVKQNISSHQKYTCVHVYIYTYTNHTPKRADIYGTPNSASIKALHKITHQTIFTVIRFLCILLWNDEQKNQFYEILVPT